MKKTEPDQQLDALFDKVPAGVLILEGPDLTVSFANPAAIKIFGPIPARVVGKPYDHIAITADHTGLFTKLDTVVNTGIPYTEISVRSTSNNQAAWLAHTYTAFSGAGKTPRLAVWIHDVTEQTTEQNQLKDSEAKYRSIFNSIDEGFCIVEIITDTDNQPVDYQVLETNAVFDEQTGFVSIVGQTARSLNLEQAWIDLYGAVAITGASTRFEQYSELLSRWFNVYASRIGGNDSLKVAIVFSNITEQKAAEAALKESEERFRTMAEGSQILIAIGDETGNATYFNKAWEDLTGRPAYDLYQRGWADLIHPEDRQKFIDTYLESLEKQQPFTGEIRVLSQDGSYRWLLAKGPVRRQSDGSFAGHISSCVDITDEKQAQQKQQQLIAITEQRNALIKINQTKDEFIALASHQLRTPATAVKQYVALLKDGTVGPVPPNFAKYLQTAYDSNERQLKIINELLKTAQIDSGDYLLDKQLYDVSAIVREAVGDMQAALKLKGQSVRLMATEQPAIAHLDPVEMKLVLINLLENASKYSYPESEIGISVEHGQGTVKISVTDQGVGIKPGDQNRIFDKFTRVDNVLSDTVAGNGLGLYWVKQIVGLHDGTVTLVSAPDQGSTFAVELPATPINQITTKSVN